MFKSAFIVLPLLLCYSISWGNSANSIEKALELKEKCTSLDINGTDTRILPRSLSSCRNITTIHFTNNTFLAIEEGLLIPSVTEVDFSGTYVNTWELGQIAQAFPNLKHLSLSSTGLTVIGSNLTGFAQLESLDLSKNALKLLPSDLQYLVKLKWINLSENQLDNQIMELGYLWNLESLNVSKNPKLNPNDVIQVLSMNDRLKSLEIDYIKNIDFEPLVIGNLETLVLRGENIRIPTDLKLLPSLSRIEFKDATTISDPDHILNDSKTIKSIGFEATNVAKTFIAESGIESVSFAGDNTWIANNIEQLKVLNFLKTLDLRKTELSLEQFDQLKTSLENTEILASNLISTSPTEVPQQIIEATKNTTVINPTSASNLTIENVDFAIPKDAFLSADGSIYRGEVKLEITVYNNALEMALDGTPMSFDNNGVTETFSSQGMLRFEATGQNGEQLEPNPENLIEVQMQNLQPKTDGDLYFYDEKEKKWKEDISGNGWGGFDEDKDVQQMIDSINNTDYTKFVKVEVLQPNFRMVARHKKEKSNIELHSMGINPRVQNTARQSSVFQYPMESSGVLDGCQLVIDSMVSHQFIDYIQMNNRKIRYFTPFSLYGRRAMRTVSPFCNVYLTFNETNDNFRLHFNIKDSSFNIPVLPFQSKYTSESVVRSQRNFTTFEMKRSTAFTQDSITRKLIDDKKSSLHTALGETLRKRALLQTKIAPEMLKMQAQMNRMGFTLGSFGLVNCDYFSRNRTSTILAVGKTFTDQNGETFESTPFVRMVYMDNSVYIDQPRSQMQLTESSQQVGIMILSATKIAVVMFTNELVQKIKGFRTVDITGKSPEEVNSIIFAEP